eukprot:2162631-Amphidinium_carterae.1
MSPLVMSSPELIKIMHAAHHEPEKLEEIKISNLRVPWHNAICLGSMEIGDSDWLQHCPGCGTGSGNAGVSNAWHGSWNCRS